MGKYKGRILIIDTNEGQAAALCSQLERANYDVHRTLSHAHGLRALDDEWHAILIGSGAGDADELGLIERAAQHANRASVIVLDDGGALDRAVEVMRLGAFDFLVKPVAPARLLEACERAVAEASARRAAKAGRRASDRTRFHGFIGGSTAMQNVYKAIESIANSRATVFITGESGTGKEVTAEALHRAGERRGKPFVAINCGAIPENLVESELFGHVRGAFTGATENRVGAAKLADGGTLFLDEICELELKLQVKLLRFLQTGMIQRVGSPTAERVDVRVVCATNRDPVVEMVEGRFREDLFYRLAVVPLDLPPLRARGGDAQLIADAFLARFAGEENKGTLSFGDSARAYIKAHDWPGNVRELQNAVRRAVILANGPVIEAAGLQSPFAARRAPGAAPMPETALPNAAQTLDEIERTAIERAVERAGGSLTAAARELGVSPSTLYRKRERWIGGKAA